MNPPQAINEQLQAILRLKADANEALFIHKATQSTRINPLGIVQGKNRLRAGTLMEVKTLPLATWFLVIDQAGQAKASISSLALMRELGVNYRTGWLMHN